MIVSSCPLLWRLNEAELLVIRQPSLNQCTMGTGKPLTVQCMETSVATATVILSGPRMMCSLCGTPVRQDIEQYYYYAENFSMFSSSLLVFKSMICFTLLHTTLI